MYRRQGLIILMRRVNGCLLYLIIALFVSINTLSAQDTLGYKNPKTALFLSMTLPGSGQIYNGKYLKSAILISVDGFFLYQADQYRQKYIDEPDNEDWRDGRNKYYWYFAGAYLYGMLDAFVDAHLSAFPQDAFSLIPYPGNGLAVRFQIKF